MKILREKEVDSEEEVKYEKAVGVVGDDFSLR